MRIFEILQSNPHITLSWKKEGTDVYTNILDSKGNDIKVTFNLRLSNVYMLDFEVNDKISPTGLGNQFEIFSLVLQAVRDFILINQPKFIIINVDDEALAKLYDILIEKFKKSFGYKAVNIKSLPKEFQENDPIMDWYMILYVLKKVRS